MSILIFFIILLVLVLIHEAGHFFSAKFFGIRVDEFGFGFPPKLFGIKRGETEYSFNALPIGGFVKIFGENPDEENTNGPDKDRSFVHKPRWQQAIVLFAGVFMNFILAWLLFAITFMAGSPLATDIVPKGAENQMNTSQLILFDVAVDSPAEKAGLQAGDIIVSLEDNNEKITNPSVSELIDFVNKEGQIIKVNYLHNNKEIMVNISPEINEEGRSVIGVAPGILMSGKFNFFESINYGFQTAYLNSKMTLVSFGKLFSGGSEGKTLRGSVTGPVGLVQIIGIVADVGFGYLLSFAAMISISLAVINLIPFPALDGGRLLFLLIEKIKGSRLNPNVVNIVNATGFVILILLMVVVTFNDVVKLF
jgi:regulator of sigma E protease